MSVKVVIIEDEKPAARKLERMLKDFPDLEVAAVLDSVEAGVKWFSANKHPDLILSDIQLGDGLSFDIFTKIPTKSFIIYITAFDQYTLRAFKLNSIDYLLKPISKDELKKAIEKFKTFIPEADYGWSRGIKSLIIPTRPVLQRIVVKIGCNLKVIPVADITCFYSENKIVYAQTSERTFPTDFTLDELESNLDPQNFFRVNRQYIIGLSAIENIHTSPVYQVQLMAQPAGDIGISRDRVSDFKRWLAGKPEV